MNYIRTFELLSIEEIRSIFDNKKLIRLSFGGQIDTTQGISVRINVNHNELKNTFEIGNLYQIKMEITEVL